MRRPARVRVGRALFVGAVILVSVAQTQVASAGFAKGAAVSTTVSTATLAAPSLLTLTSNTTLTWQASTSAFATGTRVYRSTTSGGPYVQIAQVAGLATTTYTDAGGGGGTSYYYVLSAYFNRNGALWTSANSNQVKYNATAAPNAPGITYPMSGSTISMGQWAGAIRGTASENGGPGVKSTQITIQDASGNYFDGNQSFVTAPVWLAATGTNPWMYSVPAATGRYTITARTTDNGGVTGPTTVSTVTVN